MIIFDLLCLFVVKTSKSDLVFQNWTEKGWKIVTNSKKNYWNSLIEILLQNCR